MSRPGIRQVHPVQQLRVCLPPCHHPSLRDDRGRGQGAPAAAKIADIKAGKGKGVYKFTMAISPLDCMGCGVCVGQCPGGTAITMVPQEGELPSRTCSTTASPRSPRRRTWRTTPSRAASSTSRCWSSPAPAQAAPRPAMPVSSPSSSATRCISPTPPAAPPSGAALPASLRTARTRTAAAPHGPTPCSRITPSTAWACIWASTPPAHVWQTAPATSSLSSTPMQI
jgi:NAD-dependent dihydropyrimidine dehydrogenase PreA subunit